MGALILGRSDDGTLEIMRADDEIVIADDLIEDISTDEAADYHLKDGVLFVKASNGSLEYVLTEHDRLTNTWRCVRTAEHEPC